MRLVAFGCFAVYSCGYVTGSCLFVVFIVVFVKVLIVLGSALTGCRLYD